MGQASAGEQ